MGTEISTWQIVGNKLERIHTTLAEEKRTELYDLEPWLESNPSIISSDIIIIGKQVQTISGPLDLLGIDKSGNIVVIEIKRDKLPREAIVQAIDYASDIINWDVNKISEICVNYSGKSLEELINEKFTDVNLESLNINETQRIVLVGFSISSSLERMINWLSDVYNMNINAIIMNYIKTKSGDELLTKTSIISEEVEKEKLKKKKYTIPMSDDPGSYSNDKLKDLLKKYLTQDLYSAQRIRNVFLPACLKYESLTRDKIKEVFVKEGKANNVGDAGTFLSSISGQIGMTKNDFLRQIITYDYPNYRWEKDNYKIREDYKEFVREILEELKSSNP